MSLGPCVRPQCEHMFVKRELAEKARALRRHEGMSMKRIAAELGVAVSSVSRGHATSS